eukprot:CAMPEP_0174253666 /NCGR_PEP_ID=MMETSP0439-20130205/3032_1 /TAXON_ID=0 /ORGANISM="Stereomyxa ramosa, Strain Chinc5" /LENGTH=247 /DNA_ID=CAMNT_0015334815 /DNA_START=254 /DNA_END=994 /DNA_ORIENTATION=-
MSEPKKKMAKIEQEEDSEESDLPFGGGLFGSSDDSEDEDYVPTKEKQADDDEEFSDEEDFFSDCSGDELVTKEDDETISVEATKQATETLMASLKKLMAPEIEKNGFSICPQDDNIYKWDVKLFGWDENSQIKEDMFLYESATGKGHVQMEVVFPKNYPHNPPFMRVVYPRFHQYTGHITIGGSICVKDLTKSGWKTVYAEEIETFFIMIRNLLVEGSALLNMDNLSEYTEQEGREAFVRVAQQHGW